MSRISFIRLFSTGLCTGLLAGNLLATEPAARMLKPRVSASATGYTARGGIPEQETYQPFAPVSAKPPSNSGLLSGFPSFGIGSSSTPNTPNAKPPSGSGTMLGGMTWASSTTPQPTNVLPQPTPVPPTTAGKPPEAIGGMKWVQTPVPQTANPGTLPPPNSPITGEPSANKSAWASTIDGIKQEVSGLRLFGEAGYEYQSGRQRDNNVYAAPPAYRWFGWGTTTPGANPMAPVGHYPQASARWYNHSGATPGAFPVPTVNPFRSEPSNDPPRYYAQDGKPKRAVVPASPLGRPTGYGSNRSGQEFANVKVPPEPNVDSSFRLPPPSRTKPTGSGMPVMAGERASPSNVVQWQPAVKAITD